MLSAGGIASIKIEMKKKTFNGKFVTSAKCEIVRLSVVCLLANQKNAKLFHCLVGQLDTNLNPI